MPRSKIIKGVDKLSAKVVFYVMHSPRWKAVARFVSRFFSPRWDTPVNVQGFKMYARSLDRLVFLWLLKFSVREQRETEFFSEFLKEGMTVIDVGANIGYHALQLARIVGTKGKVYAFEPEPENFRLFKKNITVNKCDQILAVQKAVADVDKKVKLYFCEEHRGDHRIFDSQDGRKSLDVDAVSLDTFIEGKGPVDLIKIDTQGGDFHVLTGMQGLIKRSKKLTIMIEFEPHLFRLCGVTADQFLDLIDALKLQLHLIHPQTQAVELISRKNLLELCQKKPYVNLLLKKDI